MLGKHVGSMKGQTEVKAIPSEYGMPKLETTGAGEGTLLGHPVQFMATCLSVVGTASEATRQADRSFFFGGVYGVHSQHTTTQLYHYLQK